jgi:RNA polymerase sigma-70 factor (ECF subfamily)
VIGIEARRERAHAVAEAAARAGYGKLVAILAARSGDVAAAEDALSDAFSAAMEQWPRTGTPERPEAWLLAVARRRTIDAVRRRRTRVAAQDHLQLLTEELNHTGDASEVPDERLRLMFACAHPAIDPGIRAPLILQTILGFDAATIASAFLISPSTMGQRLVRAKTRIKEAGIPFAVPERGELAERLAAVLDAIYATFAEGWLDAAGTDMQRRNLASEGIWLGRLVASLLPEEPEALGLLALVLFAEARRAARRNPEGNYVPLADQDMSRWNMAMIDEAEELLRRAGRMGAIGRYQLEAAVQSAHTIRRQTGRPDWAAIRQLYDGLFMLSGSPVVALNRAVAIAEVEGPAVALGELDSLAGDPRMAAYQPYWAARAEMLMRLGDGEGAGIAYGKAIGLERDPAVRRFLLRRQSETQS